MQKEKHCKNKTVIILIAARLMVTFESKTDKSPVITTGEWSYPLGNGAMSAVVQPNSRYKN